MLKQIVDCAAGRVKADIVLKNGRYVDVFGGIEAEGDIAIAQGVIAGIGNDYVGVKEYDIHGMTVIPGLIDGHVHIESSQVSPEEFALLTVPRGTTTVIADPHEIVNVCGEQGLDYMIKAAQGTPLEVRYQLPSCVPSTAFETSGAKLDAAAFSRLIARDDVCGCGEFMSYIDVVNGEAEALSKLCSAKASGKPIDGHAPALSGKALNAYVACGVQTDHECGDVSEFKEKTSKGLYCHLRHGSTTRNIAENSRAVTAMNLRRALICTDDRNAYDLATAGGMDDALRTVVKAGLNPVWAVIAATLNNAECYGLKDKGAIAPGYAADLVVVDSLTNFNAVYVFKRGMLVAERGKACFSPNKYLPETIKSTVNIAPITPDSFRIKARGNILHAISVTPGGVLTRDELCRVESADGDVVLNSGMAKLAVVERHFASGRIGLGLLKNYTVKNGAVGITVAHDSHNMIIAGDNNRDMSAVANAIKSAGGGIAVAHGDCVKTLPLDIAGLMSSLSHEEYNKSLFAMREEAYGLGISRELDPFMALVFMSLLVIPDIKLSDMGLFDVNNMRFIDICND